MALPTHATTHPSQKDGAGSNVALLNEEYTGLVEHQIKRNSILAPMINFRLVTGTDTISKIGVGSSGLGAIVAGANGVGSPQAAPVSGSEATEPAPTTDRIKGKLRLTLDTLVYARDWLSIQEDFQSMYDVRAAYAETQGEVLARQMDSTLFIAAAKAATNTSSAYGSAIAAGGFGTGNQVSFAAANEELDPAKLYQAISDLLAKMAKQDVNIRTADLMIALAPDQFFALQAAEQIVNGNYVTADGRAQQGSVFKAWGLPVLMTNNLPQTNITSHLMGANYTGDFSKLAGLIFSPRKALLAGSTIPLTIEREYIPQQMATLLQSYFMYGATPDRCEYAGALLKF